MSNLFESNAESAVYTVTQLCREINQVLANVYKNLYLKGEISGLTKAASGHCYFSIKDKQSVLPSVMFSFSARQLTEPLENGKEYVFQGTLRIYDKRGLLQFEAVNARPMGLGNLHLAFEQLKKKLAGEGLFDEVRKKPLPFLPGVIGMITSTGGAVIHDMQTVMLRKFPNCVIRIYPATVQGEKAVADVCSGIQYFNARKACDVIIVARGGGSFEELFVFNDEKLARAVAKSDIPVISAIGHETDFTICDFVADYRAATPTAAAERVVPDKQELMFKILDNRKRLFALIRKRRESQSAELRYIQSKLSDPLHILKTHYLKLDDITASLTERARTLLYNKRVEAGKLTGYLRTNPLFFKIQSHKTNVRELQLDMKRQMDKRCANIRTRLIDDVNKLNLHNPATILKRGFVRLRKGESAEKLSSVNQIPVNTKFNVEMRDGIVSAKAESIKHFDGQTE